MRVPSHGRTGLRWGAWLALCLAGSCSVDSVDLTGKSCPCAPGYVCVAGICRSDGPEPVRDGGPDTGKDTGVPDERDAGRDAATPQDAGEPRDATMPVDTGVPSDTGVPPDTGTDTGIGDGCPVPPLDTECPGAWMPDGDACRLTCITPGCATTIDCPPGRPCILNCPFATACTATTLNCGDEGCHVQCSSGGCVGLQINCGRGPCTCESGPKITCNDSCNCANSC